MLTEDQLKDFGFIETEIRIISENNNTESINLAYETSVENDINFPEPGIYIIRGAVKESGHVPIAYVGKAGGGVNKRFNEHAAGYNRNLAKGTHSAGTLKLSNFINNNGFEHADSAQTKHVTVWFKHSRQDSLNSFVPSYGDNQNLSISSYSLEEEAFITFFKNLGYNLINASYPKVFTSVNGAVDINQSNNKEEKEDEFFATLNENLAQNSAPNMFNFWQESFGSWSDDTKEKFQRTISSFMTEKFLNSDYSPKIAKYTAGQFRGGEVLVYGILNKKNFQKDSKILIFKLDGKIFCKKPFTKNPITTTTAQYLGFDE